MKTSRMQRFALLSGNLLEHYDTTLYSMLSPFLAPLFFPEQDAVTGLILTYAMIPAGFLVRPLGSLFFGHYGDNHGWGKALSLSLIGMGVLSWLFFLLPTHRELGHYAPLLLLLLRMVQSFFAAGWSGMIPLLQGCSEKQKNFWSALYSSSTIGGILCASAGVTLIAFLGEVERGWRWLYLVGSGTFFLSFLLNTLQFEQRVIPFSKRVQELWEHRASFATLIVANGFSYATYTVALVLLNGLVPLVTDISKVEMMSLNTLLLVLDFAILPLFGMLSNRYNRTNVMFAAAISTALMGIPLFSLLEGATFGVVIFIRVTLVVLGVWYSATFQAWSLEIAPKGHEYTTLSLSRAIGGQVLGTPAAAISLGIYHLTGSVIYSSLYWVALGLCASTLMLTQSKNLTAKTVDP